VPLPFVPRLLPALRALLPLCPTALSGFFPKFEIGFSIGYSIGCLVTRLYRLPVSFLLGILTVSGPVLLRGLSWLLAASEKLLHFFLLSKPPVPPFLFRLFNRPSRLSRGLMAVRARDSARAGTFFRRELGPAFSRLCPPSSHLQPNPTRIFPEEIFTRPLSDPSATLPVSLLASKN